jgi:hypothetical protein
MIDVAALDDVLEGKKPTYIRLDIEGCEPKPSPGLGRFRCSYLLSSINIHIISAPMPSRRGNWSVMPFPKTVSQRARLKNAPRGLFK